MKYISFYFSINLKYILLLYILHYYNIKDYISVYRKGYGVELNGGVIGVF